MAPHRVQGGALSRCKTSKPLPQSLPGPSGGPIATLPVAGGDRLICRLSPRDPACLPPPPRPEDGLPIEATILEAGQLHVANEARHVLGDQLLHSHARVNGPKLILIQVVPARIVKVPSCLRPPLEPGLRVWSMSRATGTGTPHASLCT